MNQGRGMAQSGNPMQAAPMQVAPAANPTVSTEIQRLMQLTEEQISRMPPDKAQMLRDLQAKVRAGQGM